LRDASHTIEIDSIVLTGTDHLHPRLLALMIQREVQRALLGTDLPASTEIADGDGGVAGEVAHAVVKSLDRGGDRV